MLNIAKQTGFHSLERIGNYEYPCKDSTFSTGYATQQFLEHRYVGRSIATQVLSHSVTNPKPSDTTLELPTAYTYSNLPV